MKAHAPTHAPDGDVTWRQFFACYSRDGLPHVSAQTRKDSRCIADDVERLLNPKKLDELPDRLDEFEFLLRAQGLTTNTVREKIGRLRGMLAWCTRRGLLPAIAGDGDGWPLADAQEDEWRQFRAAYEHQVLAGFAVRTQRETGFILNELERIAAPTNPVDLTAKRLSEYQAALREQGLAPLTIRKKLAHIKAILRWGARMGYLPAAPQIDMPRKARGAKLMKGRAITEDEFARMLAAAAEVVGPGPARVASWRRYLRGLWTSGLRLTESLELRWDGDEGIRVDQAGEHFVLEIPGDCQKNGRDQVLPIVPEFEEFLRQTPEHERTGFVFDPRPRRVVHGRLQPLAVSHIISAIGEAAGVIVGKRRGGKPKFASAHDFRRAFCTRWASRVTPLVLQEIARHANISTTKQFYIGIDAQRTASILWDAHAAATTKRDRS
jgi:integrase